MFISCEICYDTFKKKDGRYTNYTYCSLQCMVQATQDIQETKDIQDMNNDVGDDQDHEQLEDHAIKLLQSLYKEHGLVNLERTKAWFKLAFSLEIGLKSLFIYLK